MSSEIRGLFPDLGPVVGYAVTAVIRAEHPAPEGKRASTFAWWDYIQTIPAPRIVVMHDLDQPQGQGAFWGEVQANIHKVKVIPFLFTQHPVDDLPLLLAHAEDFITQPVLAVRAEILYVDRILADQFIDF